MFLTRSLLALPFALLPHAAFADKTDPLAAGATGSVMLTMNGTEQDLTLIPESQDLPTGWEDSSAFHEAGEAYTIVFSARGPEGDWVVMTDVVDGVVTWGTVVTAWGETLFQENPVLAWQVDPERRLHLSGVLIPEWAGEGADPGVQLAFDVTLPEIRRAESPSQ